MKNRIIVVLSIVVCGLIFSNVFVFDKFSTCNKKNHVYQSILSVSVRNNDELVEVLNDSTKSISGLYEKQHARIDSIARNAAGVLDSSEQAILTGYFDLLSKLISRDDQ